MRFLTFAAVIMAVGFSVARAEVVPGANIQAVSEAKQIDAILRRPESQMDLAKIKLVFDKMIDPGIDVDAGLRQIDSMVMQIRAMLRSNSASNAKVQALRTFLYEKGPWNGYQSYGYDFDDPLGKNIRNKLLSQYLASKKGNCVTMPLLFIVLGQRLGIDVTVSTAPLHLFVKYTDSETGTTYNLEATSGALPARDVWIRQGNPMTDEAIANGLYMQKLTKRETVAVMATVLTEYFAQKQEHEKVIAISDVVLAYYPKSVGSMLMKGSAYGRLGTKHFMQKYPRTDLIPPEERGYFEYLGKQNHYWFTKAETLGWREPDRDYETKYLQTISQAKSIQ